MKRSLSNAAPPSANNGNSSQQMERIERTDNQLEEFRLKLSRLKAENGSKTAEYSALESTLPNLKEALGTKELELKSLQEYVAAKTEEFNDGTSDYHRKERRVKALKKQVAENEESIRTASNLRDSLLCYKQVLSQGNNNNNNTKSPSRPPSPHAPVNKRPAGALEEKDKHNIPSPPKKRAIVPKTEEVMVIEVEKSQPKKRHSNPERTHDFSSQSEKSSPPPKKRPSAPIHLSSFLKIAPRTTANHRPSDTVTDTTDDEKNNNMNTPRTRTPKATVEVYMEESDEPNFETADPGDSGETKTTMYAQEESSAEHKRRIKQRIKYMLNLGRNSGTPEHEMSQALRNAERLLRKHNLNKADILEMEENPNLMDTDVIQVTVRSVKTKLKVPLMEWYYRLSEALALNFNVKYFYNNGVESCFVFYGLKHNSQMAAYMYKSVFAQIHLLAKVYKPDENNPEVRKVMQEATTKGAFTRQMRLSYALGICIKLIQNIEKQQKIRKDRVMARSEALAKRRRAASNHSNHSNMNMNSAITPGTPDYSSDETVSDDEGGGEEGENNEKELALITMEKNAPQIALKKKGIDLEATCRGSTQDVLAVAVKDGKVDARKINLNRREIADK